MILLAVFSTPGFLFAGEVNDYLLDVLGVEFQDISSTKKAFFFKYVEDVGVRFGASGNTGGFVQSTSDPVRLGIGKDPEVELDVLGTVKATGFTFPTDAGVNKIATSDTNGGLFWSGLGTILQTLTGYSGTANQVLKNNSGTITWGSVDSVTESDPRMPVCASGQVPKRTAGTDTVVGTADDVWSCADESDPIFSGQKGQANGIATLGADSKVPSSQLPKLVITDVLVLALSDVDTVGERTANGIEQGDVIIDTAATKTYIWTGDPGGTWKEIIAPNTVTSVNGETGTVSLSLDRLSDVDVATCTLNNVLKWNGTGWVCLPDSDSDVWTAITGGIKYTGGKVGIGVGITDAEIISPLTVKGGVAAGSFTTAGTVDAGGVIARGGNIVAQSSFSSNWKYEPGNFVAGHSAPRCNTAGTGGKLNCDISSSSPDCGGQIYDIGTDPGTAPSTCYDWYVTAGGQDEQRAYNRVSSATTGGWVSGATGYSDTISIGGDSSGDDLEIKVNAPTARNKVTFTNQTTGTKADISAKKGFFESLFIAGGSADGQVLTYDAVSGNATWRNPGSGADNWGTQTVAHDATLKGDGASATTALGIDTATEQTRVDARITAQVPAWARAATEPTYTFSELLNSAGYLNYKPANAACASGEILEYDTTLNSGAGGWKCATDTGGIAGSGTAGKIAKWTASGLGDSVITETTTGNVGIGTAAPTGKLHINSTQSVTQAAATIYNSDSNTITGLESGHPIQAGDYITLGGQGPFPVTSRGGTSVDISGAFSGTIANQNSYTLIKRTLLGNGTVGINDSNLGDTAALLQVGGSGYFNNDLGVGGVIVAPAVKITGGLTGGTDAGKFLKLNDEDGNAVWDSVPPAYADANVETWVESKMVDGDFSASPVTAKIKSALLPDLVITDTFPVSDGTDADTNCNNEITALASAKRGDVAICATTDTSYILSTDSPATFSNWIKLLAFDSDADSTNEIQTLSLGADGKTVTISKATSNQSVTINTDDADANPTNEAQTLTYTDSTRAVRLSAVGTTGGGSFTLPQGSKWADNVAQAAAGINYTGGNVGIGTASPETKLHVMGGGYFQGDSTWGTSILVNSGNGTWRWVTGGTAGDGNVPAGGMAIHRDGNFSPFQIKQDGTIFMNTGNVGIGTVAPATKLDVNGLVRVFQTATTTCSSSIEGSIFYNSSNKNFWGCDGTAWKQLDN